MSSSRSSSSSSSKTENYDQRVAADGNGVALGTNSRLTINADAPEAWELAGKALELVAEGGAALLDQSANAITGSQKAIEDQQEILAQLVAEDRRSEEATVAQQFIRLAVPLALVAGVVIIFVYRKQR